jgi:BCD family chlorophyll transporter-like MFS transporter
MKNSAEKPLSTSRNLKIGTFHIGSAMADVLGSGVWNRVMIQDLGFAATPVGLLLALRYFLAPLAMWAGGRSDQTNVHGYRRLPWIIGGRLAMALGYLMVAVATVELVRSGGIWWLAIIIGFLAISVGASVSGSTFLALVYDRAGEDNRGRAVGVVWTFLLVGFGIAGVLFSILLPNYSEGAFVSFFGAVVLIMLGLWVFSLWGEEQPITERLQVQTGESPKKLGAQLRELMASRSARMLAAFMFFSFMAAFMQDSLLEPFGGAVFDLSTGDTTRFQALWATPAIIMSGVTLWAHRRYPGVGYRRFTQWGVLAMLATFVLLALTAWTEQIAMLRPTLLLLGFGYGLWNIGTLGLMVESSRTDSAGLDLGVWTVVVTLCRGGGILLGAVFYDLLNLLLDVPATAFGIVFALEAALLVMALGVLNQIQASESPITDPAREGEWVLSSSMD